MALFVLISGVLGGFLGSILGLGGAVIIVPILTLALGVPIEYAAGASLVAAIATSSGAASAYIKDRITNIRIGMSLEICTTAGAIVGSLLAVYIYRTHLQAIIYIIFGVVLMLSVYPSYRKMVVKGQPRPVADSTTKIFSMSGSYYDAAEKKRIAYKGIRWWYGELVMAFAGLFSGLLGIGSGVLKVIALDDVMNLPTKVSTATSDFMIGVTAAVSSAIYWEFGYIQPLIAGPVAIGILVGAYIGTRRFNRMRSSKINILFMFIIVIFAVEMILKGLGIA